MMPEVTRRQRLTHTILRHLGESPPYADDSQGVDLNRRIEVQKLIYLAQEALRLHRMTLRYGDYNWYVRGPYSPAAARDCYALDGIGADSIETPELREEAVEAVRPVSDLIEARQGHLSKHEWLELLASLHYHLTRSRAAASGSDELADEEVQTFLQYKPKFSPGDVRAAWEALRQGGLLE
jgi:uncharacterized protein YwgA